MYQFAIPADFNIVVTQTPQVREIKQEYILGHLCVTITKNERG